MSDYIWQRLIPQLRLFNVKILAVVWLNVETKH